MLKVKSSGIICKGNLEGNFELVPMELYDYLEIGLISGNDLVVYIRLLRYYNPEYGYAYPTIAQLRIDTGIKAKPSIHKCLRNLISVGLIKKSKTRKGNNIYLVYKPLERSVLYACVPDKVKQIEEFKARVTNQEVEDKNRLLHYKQTKEDNEKSIIKAKQISTAFNIDINSLLPEEIETLEKLNKFNSTCD
ncbi:transcriptional regulator [Metabacillus litoralis]|uniref:Transcriptional regulator n=1 Tax=Metabacillus litoralis TaxID=152268 RepID=A0A5C6VX96_9BACI|nr:transcriptional regulator [Metabacillus litoralis]TXC89881.1 transcriptional regulator [Metabacillus litoralis]